MQGLSGLSGLSGLTARGATSGGGAPDLTTGLAHYWRLDEAGGTRVDAVGTAALVEINGAVGHAAGKLGEAASFNTSGPSGMLAATDPSFALTAFTMGGWLRLDADVGSTTVVVMADADDNQIWAIYGQAATPNLQFEAGPNFTDLNSTFAGLSVGDEWCVVVWHDPDAQVLGIRINDQEQTLAFPDGLTPGAAKLAFGGSFFGGASYLDGRLDHWGLWGRVLSVAERNALYNGGAGVVLTP